MSRISLVKLVVTIISVISSKKVVIFGGSLLLAFANTCEILSLLSKGRYFQGGRYFGNFTVIVSSSISVQVLLWEIVFFDQGS